MDAGEPDYNPCRSGCLVVYVPTRDVGDLTIDRRYPRLEKRLRGACIVCLRNLNDEELPEIKLIREIFEQPYLPQYIQLELDFMDEMFEKRMEDDRA